MANEVVMPKLGLTMSEGTVEKWYKTEGDRIEKGELLLAVATDKLTNDVEADVAGTLLKILVPEGGTAACKAPIAYIGEPGEQIGGAAPAAPAATPAAPAAGKAPSGKVGIAVIGGGPGGYVAAIRAAQLGADVTLIEMDKMGGTCLNRGCIPTKALLRSAELAEEARKGGDIGVECGEIKVNWPKVQARREAVSAQLSGGVSGLMKLNKVRVIAGEAAFSGPKTLTVKTKKGEETLSPDKIIIAAGSVPATIPIPGLKENPACIDSTAALTLDKIPESMVIIGGGVIGLEMATAYNAFGTKCTVVELLPRLLPGMDAELTELVKKQMAQKGVEFYMEAQVTAVEKGGKNAVVTVQYKGEAQKLEAEKVLVAVGRRANTTSLNLAAAGIANDRGVITVNDRMETSVPGVYAIGDCVGRTMLSHVAMVMGEVAATNATGGDAAFDERTSPSCAYVNPEFAGVGLTEEQAKAANIDYKVGRFPLSANGKSLIVGCTDGMIKVLTDRKYNEIIGVHMVGPRATDMIHEAALAIRLECTAEEFVSTIHCHPTISEAMREAVLAVDKKAIHSK